MGKSYIQLDEVKDEGEKLVEENDVKTKSLCSFRKVHIEKLGKKLGKHQEENLEFEKIAQQLHAMSKDIRELRKMYGELQSNFHRKDSLLNQISSTNGKLELQSSFHCKDSLPNQISSANGKLEADCNDKLLNLNCANRYLALSLDEAFARIHDLENKTASNSEEISGLKRLLSIKHQLISEKQKNASMDRRERDEDMLKPEEENRVIQDQLKWKNEQFAYLEEAHQKLHTQFKESKSEWQMEKSSLLDEISSLQGNLDEQIHASESLEEELRRYKAMLDESEQFRSHLQLLKLDNRQAENMRNAVERVSIELQNKTSEIEALKLKLQKSESEVETLKLNLKESQRAHEQEKTSLLVTVNDEDASIGNIEQQLSTLKSVTLAKSEAAEMLNQEKDNDIRLAEDWNCRMPNFQHEITELRKKLPEKEITNVAILDANDSVRQENENIVSSFHKREQKTVELQEEKSLPQSKQMVLQHEETKKWEIQELRDELEKETGFFDDLLEELESHKRALLEDRTNKKFSRDNLLAQLENMYQQIGFLCTEDAELMGMLRKSSFLL